MTDARWQPLPRQPVIVVTATTRVTHRLQPWIGRDLWRAELRRGFRLIAAWSFDVRRTPRKPHMAWRLHRNRAWRK